MVNEFRMLSLECLGLVPQGPSYKNITLENQVFPVTGAVPGQRMVNGLQYLKLSFNYEWSHMAGKRPLHIRLTHPFILTPLHLGLWHHCRFRLSFPCSLPRHHRVQSKLAEAQSVVTFKHGMKQIQTSVPQPGDPETAAVTAANSVNDLRGDVAKVERALAAAERMTDTFSWEGLNYTVPIGDRAERKLLNDVSGYVIPGKLTALMGEFVLRASC